MKIDESQLPPGWDAGLEVERDADGAIRRVAADHGAESIVLEIEGDRVWIHETRDLRLDATPREGEDRNDPSVLHALIVDTLGRMQGGKRPYLGLACSFCGKSSDEVRKLVAGPSVYICDECIELCSDILDDEDEPQS